MFVLILLIWKIKNYNIIAEITVKFFLIFKANKFLASFKKMHEQKVKEHQRAYIQQEKNLAALKKSGKSSKKANEDMKNKIEAKSKKGGKKKGQSSATMGDESSNFKKNCVLYFFRNFSIIKILSYL